MSQAYEVPLHELLEKVPADARLVIEHADGYGTSFIPVGRHCQQAAIALRAAIEQAEKPVAQVQVAEDYYAHVVWLVDNPVQFDQQFLYAAPPQREWVGLTNEEVRAFEVWLDDEEEKHGWNPPQDIIKYIEAKLKEKNNG